jgi:hypothetical protein
VARICRSVVGMDMMTFIRSVVGMDMMTFIRS